jgi:hypothetical protein
MGVGPVGFSVEHQNLLWVMWRRGDSIREMEGTLGETLPRIPRKAMGPPNKIQNTTSVAMIGLLLGPGTPLLGDPRRHIG